MVVCRTTQPLHWRNHSIPRDFSPASFNKLRHRSLSMAIRPSSSSPNSHCPNWTDIKKKQKKKMKKIATFSKLPTEAKKSYIYFKSANFLSIFLYILYISTRNKIWELLTLIVSTQMNVPTPSFFCFTYLVQNTGRALFSKTLTM